MPVIKIYLRNGVKLNYVLRFTNMLNNFMKFSLHLENVIYFTDHTQTWITLPIFFIEN